VPFARPKASECNLANRKQIFKISPDINRISGCVSKKRAQKNRFEFFPRGRNRRATIPFRRLERPSRRRFVHFDIRCVRATKKINRFHRTIYIFLPRKERERERERTAGAAGFSVSATSPSALTIKDRLLEDLTCARVAVADKTALFAMVDAKDIVIMRLF
jgi:hypothetical protein